MDNYKAKPQGNYAILVILWLLVVAALTVVGIMLTRYESSSLNTVIFIVIPLFFIVPAVAATFATVASSLSVEEGCVRCTIAAGFKRYTVEIALSEVRAVWAYRRTVVSGRHTQVASGCAFRRADGATMHLDLTLYTDQQRRDFLAAVCASSSQIETLPFAKDTGRVFAQTLPPVWEGAPDASSAGATGTATVEAHTEAPRTAVEVQAADADAQSAARPAVQGQEGVYRYKTFEGEGSVRCSLCGARIASAVTPGEHQTGGYLSSDGKKWVCKDCWARFARDYRWTAED